MNSESGDAIRLPDFNVIEPRRLSLAGRPHEEELLTRYVGRARGLDRALLNRLVLRWETNLFVRTLDGAQDNRTRARNRYADDLRLHQRAQLLDFAALVDRSGDPAAGTELKRESDRLFFRPASPRRK